MDINLRTLYELAIQKIRPRDLRPYPLRPSPFESRHTPAENNGKPNSDRKI